MERYLEEINGVEIVERYLVELFSRDAPVCGFLVVDSWGSLEVFWCSMLRISGALQGSRGSLPPKSVQTNNITAAWAVDREFVYIVGPAWAPFGRLGPPLGSHWDAFGATLVSLWFPLGAFGSPLTGLWTPVGRLGTPLGSIWSALGPRGSMWGSHWVAGPIWEPRER